MSQLTNWEKISDDRLKSKLYQSSIWLLENKYPNFYNNEGFVQTPLKRADINDQWPASLIIRELHIKIPVRDHLSHVRMAITKTMNHHRCWWTGGEKGNFVHWSWALNSYIHFESWYSTSLKSKIKVIIWSLNPISCGFCMYA